MRQSTRRKHPMATKSQPMRIQKRGEEKMRMGRDR